MKKVVNYRNELYNNKSNTNTLRIRKKLADEILNIAKYDYENKGNK